MNMTILNGEIAYNGRHGGVINESNRFIDQQSDEMAAAA